MLFTKNILFILLFAIAIFFVFKFLQILISKFISGSKLKNRIQRTLLFAELVVWIGFLYRIAESQKHEKPVLSFIAVILLILIIVWAFWFVLKDYFAGLYFKMFEDYKINNRIRFENTDGKIIDFESRHLILQTSEGSLKVPYSKLFGKQISRLTDKHEEEFVFTIESKSGNISEEFINELHKKILLMPWINLNYSPQIETKNIEDKTVVEIKIVLLDTAYKTNVQAYFNELKF